MADIFISYSSKDRAQAEQLIELLTSAGLSVWIDKSGIDVSTHWSSEIVDAINECKAFVVLLSPNSVKSINVIKEVSLASEKHKKILPLDLEPVALTRDFEYQLAGIQRAPMTNINSIIRALGKLGLEATRAAEAPKVARETDGRKSLMIIPFEDLSPTGDNGWFTDGIASEMVSTLSNIKSLRLIDWNSSSLLKHRKVSTIELARDFSVRYFIEGQVRKFGNQIKIAMTLLDIETGDHLWQDSLKGTMDDIFDIQEQCAARVVAGLELHLTKEEQAKVSKKLTDNAEAYELYLKATEYYDRHTQSDYGRALALFEEVVRIDPACTTAYATIANTCIVLVKYYAGSDILLERSRAAALRIHEIEGDTAPYFWVMSMISLVSGDGVSALHLAERAVDADPEFAPGHAALGEAYQVLGRHEERARALGDNLRLRANDPASQFNYLLALSVLTSSPESQKELREAARRAVPVFQRRLRLNPDDYQARVLLANVYGFAGDEAEALTEAEALAEVRSLDGSALYNLACLFLHCHQRDRCLQILRQAVESGLKALDLMHHDPALDSLRRTDEFEALMKELEAEANG